MDWRRRTVKKVKVRVSLFSSSRSPLHSFCAKIFRRPTAHSPQRHRNSSRLLVFRRLVEEVFLLDPTNSRGNEHFIPLHMTYGFNVLHSTSGSLCRPPPLRANTSHGVLISTLKRETRARAQLTPIIGQQTRESLFFSYLVRCNSKTSCISKRF